MLSSQERGEWEAKENVPSSVLKRAQRQPRHLRCNPDAALVQQPNCILVPMALLAQQILRRDLDVIEVDDTGAARLDAQLLLLLRNAEPFGALLDNKGGDALVLLLGGEVGKDDEEVGLHRVGDPHLAAADLVAARRGTRGLGRQREGVGARHGLRQAEGADGVAGQPGQVLLLDGLGAPLEDGRVDQGVVHVAHDAHAGVDARKLLDGDDGGGEVHAAAAVLLGDLDAHQALLEQLLHHGRVHGLGLVHLARLGQDHLGRELGDCLAHHGFRLGEVRDGRGRDVGDVDGGIAAGGGRGEAAYSADIN